MGKVSNTNVFIASTPYHIIVSCAFMKNGDYLIVEENDSIDKYILDEYAKKTFNNKIIYVDYYRNLFGKDFFRARRNFGKIKKKLDSNEIVNIYAFNDAEPYVQYLFKYYKKCNCCILEEGIGLYNNMYHRKKLKKIIYGKIFFGFWYTIIHRIGEYKYTNTIFPKSDNLLTKKQLEKKIIIENYDNVNNLLKKSNTTLKRKVWYISQPLVEDEICDEETYANFFEKIINIASKNNIKIALKPHPRENKDKYYKYGDNIEIIDKKGIPFELLLDTSEKVYLFTISSSSVFKFSGNSNVNIYFLHKLIQTKIDYSNIYGKKDKSDIINTDEEFEEIIKGIKNE